MSQSRLFVGNLSFQTGENELQDYFAQAGAVTSVNLMLDKVTGKSRGFAFVEFATPEEAQKAVEQFHNKEFQGRTLPSTSPAPARNALRVRAADAVGSGAIAANRASAINVTPSGLAGGRPAMPFSELNLTAGQCRLS